MEKPRIFFVNPTKPFPVEEHYNRGLHFTNSMQIPLELAYLGAMVPDHFVELLDAHFYRIPHEEVAKRIEKTRPGLVVIPTTTIDRWECPPFSIQYVFDLAREIKKRLDVSILVFGPHTTSTPSYVFEKSKDIDFAISGEPDQPFSGLVQELADGKNSFETPGIAYCSGKEVVYNPIGLPFADLDEMPFPAFDLLPIFDYQKVWDKGLARPVMLTSRGCPYNCIFCYRGMYANPLSPVKDHYYRYRSPKNVVDEMEIWIKKYGAGFIGFNDWEFCLNQERVYQICDEIKKRGLKVEWSCNTRFPDINEPLLKAMKEAGLVEIKVGLESGSRTIIQNIDKNLSLEAIPEKIALLKKLGIRCFVYGLIANPGETDETLKESVKYSIRSGAGTGSGKICVPYPGTRLFEQAKKEFGSQITWGDLPRISGRVGTALFSRQSVDQVYLKIGIWGLLERLKLALGINNPKKG